MLLLGPAGAFALMSCVRGAPMCPLVHLQQGPNTGERLSDCHLNTQRLINSLGAEVHENAGLVEDAQAAIPYKIARFLRKTPPSTSAPYQR
jgi:hypothetical protein